MKFEYKNYTIYRHEACYVMDDYLDTINDKNYCRYLEDQEVYSLNKLKKYVEACKTTNDFLMVIYDNNINQFVGNIRLIKEDTNKAFFGRLVYKKFTGAKYGSKFSEIMKHININFFKIKLIISDVNINNIISIKSHLNSNPSKHYRKGNKFFIEHHFDFK